MLLLRDHGLLLPLLLVDVADVDRPSRLLARAGFVPVGRIDRAAQFIVMSAVRLKSVHHFFEKFLVDSGNVERRIVDGRVRWNSRHRYVSASVVASSRPSSAGPELHRQRHGTPLR